MRISKVSITGQLPLRISDLMAASGQFKLTGQAGIQFFANTKRRNELSLRILKNWDWKHDTLFSKSKYEIWFLKNIWKIRWESGKLQTDSREIEHHLKPDKNYWTQSDDWGSHDQLHVQFRRITIKRHVYLYGKKNTEVFLRCTY